MIKIHLSKLLGERRITQAELANKTNIRPATINEMYHELIERINLEHLNSICKVLDIVAGWVRTPGISSPRIQGSVRRRNMRSYYEIGRASCRERV